jgi:TolB-like protein/DNA-binding winged helix-turn-helix (wHTH) protein/thioredoxin-like negative regulator of GroEL
LPREHSESTASRGSPGRGRFLFDEFELDVDRGRLSRGGGEIPLRPKTFAVLQYLLEHPGRLVTRQELLDAVWPNLVVTDDSVTQCLIELRRALGDDEHLMIRTVPRRGLVLEVPVRFEESADSTTPPAARRAKWAGWAIGALPAAFLLGWWVTSRGPATIPEESAAPLPVATSIAVLRFADLSPAGDQAYLADGMSEEIIHSLAQSPSLRVIARASSFAVEGQPIETIARQLDVTHVLEGSVRTQGRDIRVTAQLIDAASSTHIWSASYDRDLDDLLTVQREIAIAVARSLDVRLAGADVAENVDPQAYQLFLEGRHFYLRRAEGDLDRARERYEQALAISPEFARAWTGLSAVASIKLYGDRIELDPDPNEAERLLEVQRQATQRALQYGPDLPEAHVRAARYYAPIGDLARARRHVEIARSIDPDHWLVRSILWNELLTAGHIDEAVELIRREIQRDPLNMVVRGNLVGFLIWAGRYEEARAALDAILEISPTMIDQSLSLTRHSLRLRILLDEFEETVLAADTLTDSQERLVLLAMGYHGLGRQADAEDTLAQLAARSTDDWGALATAEVLAQRGESDRALEWLHRIEFRKTCGRKMLERSIYYSPFLNKLSGTPAWEAYRSALHAVMKDCLLGLDIESV